MEGEGEPHLPEEGMRPREGRGLGHRHTASDQGQSVPAGLCDSRVCAVPSLGGRQRAEEPQPLGCRSEGLRVERGPENSDEPWVTSA